MIELMATLKFVRAYIDDLLCITKGDLDNHLARLKLVLTRLQDANLKVNARKSFFCTMKQNILGTFSHKKASSHNPRSYN